MDKKKLRLLFLLLLAGGCRATDAAFLKTKSESSAVNPAAGVLLTDEEYQARTDEFLVSGFEFLRATGPYLSREQIVLALGDPVHEAGDMMWFDYKTYGHNFYRCTMGIKTDTWGGGSSKRDYIKAISMTSDKYAWRYGIKIGSHRDYIRKVLGEPYETQQYGEEWRYLHSGNMLDIYFKFKDDVVSSIKWYYNPR